MAATIIEMVKGPPIAPGTNPVALRTNVPQFTPAKNQRPGLLSRFNTAARNVISTVTPATWMSPNQPIAPQAPEGTRPRLFDYLNGYNLQMGPRPYEPISVLSLRAMARNCDIVRLAIQTRKDQVTKISWDVRKRDGVKTKSDDKYVAAIKLFMRKPDGRRTWDRWIRRVMEDMLVLDAIAIERVRGGSGPNKMLAALRCLDGGTIKPIIDDAGDIPLPPDPAYQQWIKGMPAVNFTTDELSLAIMNERSDAPLGLSPVEQVLFTALAIMKREFHTIAYFTDGTMPDMIITAPAQWTSDQIAEYQAYLDGMLAGNSQERRRMRFVPSGLQPIVIKEPVLKAELDEWLARIVQYAFSLPATPYVKQMNRATAETVAQTALEEGLFPMLGALKAQIFDPAIQEPSGMGLDDYEMVPKTEREQDILKQAQADKLYIDMGKNFVNELRERDGEEPVEGGDIPYVLTTGGAMPLKEITGGALLPQNKPQPQLALPNPNDPNAPAPGNKKPATTTGKPPPPKGAAQNQKPPSQKIYKAGRYLVSHDVL